MTMDNESGGIQISRPESQIEPPLAGEKEEAAVQPGRLERMAVTGGAPIHPALVKMPLRAEGIILTHYTGFEGWLYDEATLNDLGDMAQQLDVRMNPMAQFIIALVSAHMIKVGGYVMWVKAGKPEPKKREEVSG